MHKLAYFKKNIVLVIEIIVLILLAAIFVHRNSQNNVYDIDIEDMSTGCDEMDFDGSKWYISPEDGNALTGEPYLIFGPNMPLERGTYTLVLNYSTSRIQKGVVEVDEGVIDTADFFLLSNNKNEIRYDFVLKTDVQGFKFRLKEFYGGDFTLEGMTIIRNSHDIRSLIFVWIVISVIVDLFIYVPAVRNNKKQIAIIAGIAFVASLPIFPKGIMTGDDITYHFVRIEGLAEGLRNGVFPVKMYPIYNDSYGYPVGIFYGDVLLYFPAILRLIGFTAMQSYKAYLFGVNLLTAFIAYFCGKKMFSKVASANIFALAYTFSTYRLVCMYARAAMGEYSATCFYPIVMLAVWNLYTGDSKKKDYKKNAIVLAVGMAGLIYTHILSTEMFILALAVLAIALFKLTFRKETFSEYVIAVGVCLLLCLAFIVPFVEYYMGVDIMIKHKFAKSYIQTYGAFISDYFAFFKSIVGGNYSTRRELLTPGLVLMSGLIGGIILIATGKADKKIKVTTTGALVSLFVASNLCPWDIINDVPVIGSFLVSVQFPYRYIGIASCFLSVLLVLVIERLIELDIIGKNLYRYVALASVLMTFLFVSYYQDESYVTSILRSYDSEDLSRYTRTGDFGMVLGTIYLMDGTDMSVTALDYSVYGENSKAAILGEEGVKLALYVDADDNSTVEVPRFAYPHFEVRDKDGNGLSFERGYNNRIRILFPTAYQGEVYIYFVEPWYWRVAELISAISVIGVILKLYLDRKKQLAEN